jgi:hypothetical protein
MYICALLNLSRTGGADLDAVQLERKIRLLALADLGFQNIGQDLSYAQVSSALKVPTTQVERWVIDGKVRSFASVILN